MRTYTKWIVGFVLALSLIAAPALADKHEQKAKDEKAAGEMHEKAEKGAREMGQKAEPMGAGKAETFQASQLMDLRVNDPQGNEIGQVSDVLIDSEGNVEYIVLSEGDGILGFGDGKLRPVPWDKVDAQSLGEDQEALTIAVDKERLKDAPAFSKSEWQGLSAQEREQQIRGYYGEEEGTRTYQKDEGQQMMEKGHQKMMEKESQMMKEKGHEEGKKY
jgi:sporulation protein YlmC with PRC-barrel domain